MSLIATASPWNNNDSTKKRIPTMRKTMKKISSESKRIDKKVRQVNFNVDSDTYIPIKRIAKDDK